MAPNPRRIDAKLEALYEKLPKIECQGLCYDSCGPIDLSLRERNRMEKAAGHALGVNGISCNMLVEGRCSVYAERPLICRMWGVTEGLPCIYGCEPEGGPMPDSEAALLLAESLSVGGGLTHADDVLFKLLAAAREEQGENFDAMLKAAFKHMAVRPTLAGRVDKLPGLER